MKKKISSFEKIRIRVKEECDLDIENVRRLYTGKVMKSSGAWCWISNIVGGNLEVGSPHQVKQLLKSKKIWKVNGWSSNQYEIEKED